MDALDAPEELAVRRTDSIYAAHGYLTKVPVAAIVPFIERYAPPGGTVCDPFAGSGMTGIAAVMTGRRARLSDISVLGRHLGTNYVRWIEPARLRTAARRLVADVHDRLGDAPYSTTCSRCGDTAEVIKRVWTVLFECASCRTEISYYDALAANGWSKTALRCSTCFEPLSTKTARRLGERVVHDLVICSCRRTQQQQNVVLPELDPEILGLQVPSIEIGEDREMYRRSALRKHGLTETRAFFSPRNLAVLAALRAAITEVDDVGLREKLLFGFTGILARASKRYQWSRQRPLNASNQTYYVAPVFYEWNVFDLFLRKIEAIVKSDAVIHPRGTALPHAAETEYRTASARRLDHLPDGSVDYVFTDPPFGSNIFYSDMNLFSEAWLGELTDHSDEAVVRTARSEREASEQAYEELLRAAFRECRRILPAGRYMTVVFSNSSGRMWALLQRALSEAGFAPSERGLTILDKGQRSVKGLASGLEDTITSDLMITVRRQADDRIPLRAPSALEEEQLVRQALGTMDGVAALTASRLYLLLVREHLCRGWTLESLDLSRIRRALPGLGVRPDRRTERLERILPVGEAA